MVRRIGVCAVLGMCLFSVTGFSRPVDIMPEARLKKIQAVLPYVSDTNLNDIFNSDDTMWYDKVSLTPGYQDSHGDNQILPIGFRPNTIEPNLINLAVPGGHEQVFLKLGQFHFPFGRTAGLDSASNTFVIDFWKLPRVGGKIQPVVWTKWEPNKWTARYEWMFPIGTVFGEVLFITDSGNWYPFEVRLRTRYDKGWTVDLFRPFQTADQFATALDDSRKTKASWTSDSSIDNLIQHLKDSSNLVSSSLTATHFKGAFNKVDGYLDSLPGLADNSILKNLLRSTSFESVKGQVWKQEGVKVAYGPSASTDFSIVPKQYEGALFEVNETFCNRCHQDAGRPFQDYYKNISAYGELWGEDDVVSWHPFEESEFVDKATGKVRNFNYDNRKFRKDFVDAGLVEKYSSSKHSAKTYQRLIRSWKNYKY